MEKEERSSSVPHIAKTDRKKIQRSQTEGAKHQKSEDSTTGTKRVSYLLWFSTIELHSVLRIYGISIFVECVWLSSNQWFSLTSRPVKNVKRHRAIEPRVTSYPTYHALRCFLHCWCVLCSRYMRALPSIVSQEREFETLKLTLDAVAPCLE